MAEKAVVRNTPRGLPTLMPAPLPPLPPLPPEVYHITQVVEEVIEEVKRVYPNVTTTLPLRDLLEPGGKKRSKGIPRPQNCFMLYRKDVRAEYNGRGEALSVAESSRIAAERWKTLPQEEKNFWHALYEIVKMQHSVKYPDYKYQPVRGRQHRKSKGIMVIGKKNSGGDSSTSKVRLQGEHQFQATLTTEKR